jgi:hypothetical protein
VLSTDELNQITELAASAGRRAWLTRGIVRCGLLAQIEGWDDVDIITDAPDAELNDTVAAHGMFCRTTFGGYRLYLDSGRQVDIWSMGNTMGNRCEDVATALAQFEFNVDAIAMLLPTCEVVDPLVHVPELLALSLSLQPRDTHNPYFGHSAYVPLKAAYLVLRHGFHPTSSILDLWRWPPSLSSVPPVAVERLRDELRYWGDRLHLSNEIAIGSDGFRYYRRVLIGLG